MKIVYKYFCLILLLGILACDKGLSPVNADLQKAGFSGTINFVGAWPDSVARTHIVVFKDPLNSTGDFNPINLRYVSLEIPYGVRKYNYNSLDSSYVPITAGSFSYLAVVQSNSQNLSLNRIDWKVVGVYYNNNDTTKPGTLIIPDNTLVTDVNITCDFNHPPKQPPGGK